MEKVLITGISGAQARVLANLLSDRVNVCGVDDAEWRDAPRGVTSCVADLRKRSFEDVMRTERPDSVVHLGFIRHFRGDERTVELGAALVRGDAPAQDDCWNTFDLVAGEVLMGLTDARRRVAAATQQVAVLAGAGPSLFLLGEPGALEAAAGQLNAEGSGRARLVQPLSREAATHVEQRPDEVATAGEA